MNKSRQNDLKEELVLVGASSSEVDDLLHVASGLVQLRNPKLDSGQTKQRRKWKNLIPIGISALSGLAVGMVLVVMAQTVLPGSHLYPIQKLSDNVAISINPDYRGNVMMKRAQQVKQLVAKNAKSNLVLATLSDYQLEATSYKSKPTNYAVFEYCKNNLQQAANSAPINERQAINNTLSTLENA